MSRSRGASTGSSNGSAPRLERAATSGGGQRLHIPSVTAAPLAAQRVTGLAGDSPRPWPGGPRPAGTECAPARPQLPGSGSIALPSGHATAPPLCAPSDWHLPRDDEGRRPVRRGLRRRRPPLVPRAPGAQRRALRLARPRVHAAHDPLPPARRDRAAAALRRSAATERGLRAGVQRGPPPRGPSLERPLRCLGRPRRAALRPRRRVRPLEPCPRRPLRSPRGLALGRLVRTCVRPVQYAAEWLLKTS